MTENTQQTENILDSSELGTACFLMTRSALHRHLFVGELEWYLIPAISRKQFKLFRDKQKVPMGFITWAYLTEDVENRLLNGIVKLKPEEWRCGPRPWIIDIVAPFGNDTAMLKSLANKEFKNKKCYTFQPKPNGIGFEAVLLQDLVNRVLK